jgi:predicted MFS family arabinose efflux permease
MFYYQRDTLKFGLGFIGDLEMILALFGIAGAWIYGRLCFRRNLRSILGWSIVIHAAGTLFYLLYRTPNSAIAITALEGVAQTMAILPLYDLAARATPRGSEALGYCIMMSVWNLTNNLSDWLGSHLYTAYGLTFMNLVWLNAGTTALVLLAVPFLPSVLVDRTDRSFVD